MQILTFICNQEFVSLALLIEIFNDNAETFDTIERLFDQMLIEFTTSNKEYIRANDAIKDYVQRLGLKLDSSHENKFRDHVLHSMSDYNTLERDLSDYYISTTYALKNGLEVPNELLIPSHFLNAMKSLYNNEKRFNDVVTLADRVLPHSPFLDSRIIHEVRFWLCQALARLRDRRMLKEVQKVSGPDHNLLLGFYYRMVGQLEKAKAKFHTLLEEHPNMRRAKRELVQVHLNLEEFEEARELAEENYRADKNNVYNLQNYFRCIIKDENSKDFEKTEVLQKLLIELNENRHDKARGMFLESSAWYEYYMMNQYSEAIGKIDSAIEEFPDSIYFYLQRIEITRKENDLYELKESLTMYDNNFHDNKNTGNKLSYLKGLIYLKTKSGKKFQAKQMLDEELRGKYSASVITKIEREVGL
ncbi:hypothetical protein JCM19298_487 [Nonlabens ulvanivorans]|nr:hypothetical protein JCM19298_487 [Nonlabens ulvanivorans]